LRLIPAAAAAEGVRGAKLGFGPGIDCGVLGGFDDVRLGQGLRGNWERVAGAEEETVEGARAEVTCPRSRPSPRPRLTTTRPELRSKEISCLGLGSGPGAVVVWLGEARGIIVGRGALIGYGDKITDGNVRAALVALAPTWLD